MNLVLLINIPLFRKKVNFTVQSFTFFSTLVKDFILKTSKQQYVLLCVELLLQKVTLLLAKNVIKLSDLFWFQYYSSNYSNYMLDLKDIQIKF